MNKIKEVLLISYVPLMYCSSALTISPTDIDSIMPKTEVEISCCLWLIDDKSHQASMILVLDKSKEVYDHLSWWSEGKIKERLQVVVGDNGNMYCVAIVPKLNETIQRHKATYAILNNGENISDDVKYTVFYKPLMFFAKLSDTYKTVKPILLEMTSINIGIIENQHVDFSTGAVECDMLLNLGMVDIADNNEWSRFVETSLDDPE